MRILLYIEPYPLCNEMDHLSRVAIEFANMLVEGGDHPDFQEHDIRMFSNREVLSRVQEVSFASKRFLLWPEREEMDLFRSGLTDWTTGGISGWRELLRGEGEISMAYFSVLDAVRERFPFDMIVHWGENRAVKLFAEKRGLGRVAIMPGFLRPPLMDTFIFDSGGSGSDSTLASAPIKSVIEATKDLAWPASADRNALTGEEPLDLARTIFGALNFSGCEHILNRGDRRAAFVPLHPHDSADFLANSDFITPAEFLQEVIVPLAKKKLLVAVRPERACWDALGGDTAMEEARKTVAGLPDRILWLDPRTEPVSASQLLNLTDGVITANGHFAFQAMLFEKPVSIVGDAAYKPDGVFFKPEDIARGRFHRKAYPEAIKALRTFILRAYLVPRTEVFAFPTFMRRVLDAVANVDRIAATPTQVLQELLTSYGPDEPMALIREPLPETAPLNAAAAETAESSEAESKKRSFLGKIIGKARLPSSAKRQAKPNGASRQNGEPVSKLSVPELPQVFPLSADERETIELAREVLRTQTRRKRKLAVILHCAYRDTTHYILDRLSRIPSGYDLICTVPEFSADRMEQEILQRQSTAMVVPLPNRGEHVWPFLFILRELGTDKYETVLKLHTRKYHDPLIQENGGPGHIWLDYALSCLLGQEDTRDHVTELLKSGPDWSLAGPVGLLIHPGEDTTATETELKAAGLNPPDNWTVFSSAMFWADPTIFEPILPALSNPEKYAPPQTIHPHAFTATAETLLTVSASCAEKPLAGLLPNSTEPEFVPPPIPGTIEDVLRTFKSD